MELACRSGNLDLVKKLGRPDNPYPISCAALNGHLEIVKYLISIGSHIDVRTIENAIINGYLDIVKYLIDNKVFISSNFIEDITMKKAIFCGQLDIFKYLVSINIQTPNFSLAWSIHRGHFKLAKYLIFTGEPLCMGCTDLEIESIIKEIRLEISEPISEYIGSDIASIIIPFTKFGIT